MPSYWTMPQYKDCCCDDCRHYDRLDGCEVFDAALGGLPQGFGEMVPAPTTSICHEFEPSCSLLMDMADAQAYSAEKYAREKEAGRL